MMEALYSKLYDKYQKLKTRKLSNLENLNDEQNTKFLNYVSAAESMIELLKNENERLQEQISELKAQAEARRSELVDSSDKIAECQSLLLEENLKRTELSNEVEKLHSLLKLSQEGSNHKENVKRLTSPLDDIRKRQRSENHSQGEPEECRPDKVSSKGDGESLYKVDNCGLNTVTTDSCHEGCLFHTLLESLVGMNFYSVKQKDGLQLSVHHHQSGYSFSLSWIKKQGMTGADDEILYQVCSLGTFERIAPEWMREDVIFTVGMYPLFFKRISQVIGLHS